ncbi:MAG: DMT family transporter [Anaerolineales bacterium]|nr:DMT family transporter [Anaerolineales bacterium]
MPLFAIFLLLLAALFHTAWNFLLKSADEKYFAITWQSICGGVLALGLMFFFGAPPRQAWGFLAVSVLLEVVYFMSLSSAYADHDFSLIYPIARGAAPALLALWSAVFLGERLTFGGYIGLALVTGGMAIIGSAGLLHSPNKRAHLKGILSALGVALVISLYSFVDGAAVRQTPSLQYGLGIFVFTPLLTAPYVGFRYGWDSLFRAWKKNRGILMVGGALGVGAYLLALYVYSFAPISYTGAIREISVVIGAFLGWRFLKERMGEMRVVGSLVVFSGVMIIALFG